jgi:hypothetical protein
MPGYEDFNFEPPRGRGEAPATDDAGDGRLVADKLPLVTDREGAARFTVEEACRHRAAQRSGGRSQLHRPQRRGADRSTSRCACGPAAVVLGIRPARWASAARQGVHASRCWRWTRQGKPLKGQALEVRGRLAQVLSTRKRMVGGFYAYDNRTEHKDLGLLCSGRSPTSGSAACQATLDAAGEVELVVQATRRRRRAGAGRHQRLGHPPGRAVVRAGQRRPHRRAAREAPLRTRRDRAAAGAHALPRGHGPGGDRARRRDRHARGHAARRRPDASS